MNAPVAHRVAALSLKLAETVQTALDAGWDEDAESRMLIERRGGTGGVEVRLTRKGREFLGPMI
jgi:hypothetical protein